MYNKLENMIVIYRLNLTQEDFRLNTACGLTAMELESYWRCMLSIYLFRHKTRQNTKINHNRRAISRLRNRRPKEKLQATHLFLYYIRFLQTELAWHREQHSRTPSER